MSILSKIRSIYLRYLSKPKSDRLVFQTIRRQATRRIVEVGVATGHRALRMIEFARLVSPGEEISYVGMDLFEGRSEADGPGLSLKEAHQLLRGTGARTQLVPGHPADALVRVANSLGKVDLLIVPAELGSPEQKKVWFFVPRMLHDTSIVLVEHRRDDGSTEICVKSRSEIDELARTGSSRRAA